MDTVIVATSTAEMPPGHGRRDTGLLQARQMLDEHVVVHCHAQSSRWRPQRTQRAAAAATARPHPRRRPEAVLLRWSRKIGQDDKVYSRP